MKITVLTLFPDWFRGPLGESIMRRAIDAGVLQLGIHNYRDWATDRHQSVDDRPYGGGPGMVIGPQPLATAMDEVLGPPGSPDRPWVIHLSPRGCIFRQEHAELLSKRPALAFLCGHYEGIDQRIIDTRVDEEFSLGDFVLTGGEIPAMAMIDAIVRLLPGALGNSESALRESFSSGLLEAPQYTRPEVFEGIAVPEVLLSGNHAAAEAWREEKALWLTAKRRPDLIAAMVLYPEQRRRIARRARPLVIYRSAGGWRQIDEILFQSRVVVENAGVLDDPKRRDAEPTLVPGIFCAEVKGLRPAGKPADREALAEDLRQAISEGETPIAAALGFLLKELELSA